MAYLFDTDVVSAVLRPRPHLGMVRRLATVPTTDQFTSAITLGELVFGATRRGRDDLLKRVDELTEVVPVLAFDQRAAQVFGQLKAHLEQEGIPLAEPDLRIAAIALSNELTLITHNTRHFSRVPGLLLEDWLE